MSPAPRPLAAVPTLADLQADTATLDQLPLDTLVTLRRQVRHLDVDLDAAITRLMARAEPRSAPAEPDRLLSPAQAAAMFGVKPRWLLDHADELPGARRLSRKVIRFSERALRGHLQGIKA
jgi:hypothetical protein